MTLNFRIDFGYQYLYSRRHYHPVYRWDGHLECSGGDILEAYKLDYPVIWFGPGHCPIETKLPSPEWECKTKRGFSGVRFVADVSDDAVFTLVTASGKVEFTAKQISDDGRIVFPIGPKYLNCSIIVTRTGYLWFMPKAKDGEMLLMAKDLPLPCHDWARMECAWLAADEKVSFTADIPQLDGDVEESLLHLTAMIAPEHTPGAERQVHDVIPMRLWCDGEVVAEFSQYLRMHDTFMQLLDDVWVRFSVKPGRHEFALENCHKEYFLLINKLSLRSMVHNHGELSLPKWMLKNESVTGRVYASRDDFLNISTPDGLIAVEVKPGWNSFDFTINEAGTNFVFTCGTNTAVVETVYDIAEEKVPVMVGFDMTTVPHDDNGFMDWILDYTERTRLGNLVVFRSFLYNNPGTDEPRFPQRVTEGRLLRKWGEFCREHHIYVEAANDFDDGNLVEGAGDMIHSVGRHEFPGAVYARDPSEPWMSEDMKQAAEHFLEYLKPEIDRAHRVTPRAAFGDASGGARYCYMAGADFIRSETMVPHTMHLCSQARPAAEVFRDGEWGVHIAIHHPMQPYFENHLGQYYLSLMQPWMMGASMIYEEDSLFVLFKEERQTWDDALTKGKRDMTREFFRFAKTHPRKGRCVRNIAFIEGRYAAPFNGFICDVEQDPDYSVWGYFGNNDPTWGHGQPEKCRQLLDVLMPGANTHPLRQKYDKRRFFFSGTPYGDFDEVPIEATADYFGQYKLMLNLGWNTMLDEDYDKLKAYVENGGVLFTGIPQFSTHVRRDFLTDFDDLALYSGGDISDLAGIKVNGRGGRFSGQWNSADRESMVEPELSAMPSHSPDEDGDAYLADITLSGAETVAWDKASGEPLVTRFKLGKGYVYTFTAWAYPGHEYFQSAAAAWIAKLSRESMDEIYVEDASSEVFWTIWRDGDITEVCLLNTDWSTAGNVKDVVLHTPNGAHSLSVRERQALFVTIRGDEVIETSSDVYVEHTDDGKLRLHGTGRALLIRHGNCGDKKSQEIDFGCETCINM